MNGLEKGSEGLERREKKVGGGVSCGEVVADYSVYWYVCIIS